MRADAGDEETLIDVASVVAGGAGEAEAPGGIAEDLGAVEQHVAIGHQEQVAFVDTLLLEIEHQPWQRVLIVEIAAGRQPGGEVDGEAGEDAFFRNRRVAAARREDRRLEILDQIVDQQRSGRGERHLIRRQTARGDDTRLADAGGEFEPGETEGAKTFGVGLLDRLGKGAEQGLRLIDLRAGEAGLLQGGRGVGEMLANRRRDRPGGRRMQRVRALRGERRLDRLPMGRPGRLIQFDQALGSGAAENAPIVIGGQHPLDQGPVDRVEVQEEERVEIGMGNGVPGRFRLQMGAGRLDKCQHHGGGEHPPPQTSMQICEQLFT